MNILRIAFVLCTLSTTLLGSSFRDDFAVVLIDADSEAELGAFPLDRSMFAKAIRRADDLQAKGVVMKFFFDQPKGEASDLLLTEAISNTPVLLQARIDDTEPNPNRLPDRFTLPKLKSQTEISGHSGWIPLPRFSAKAADVGFVDFSSTHVPLLESYQSRTVKSLVVCCIELAIGKKVLVEPNQSLKFGVYKLLMDDHYGMLVKLPPKDDLEYIPFHQFLNGEVPLSKIKGKIVIFGYDGSKMHSIPTAIGPIRAHRFFVYVLQSIYEQMGK